MAPKRKMEITIIDDNERALYAAFQNAANHLSQFYAQSLNQQRVAFEAGQKYGILKLHEWMLERLQEGEMVTVSEILGYLQAKLNGPTPSVGTPDQGASRSRQNSASPEMAGSSSAPQDEDTDPGMQMD